MTVTIELPKEESEWVASRPDANRALRDMIRSRMEAEQRRSARDSRETRDLVQAARDEARQLKEAGMTKEQAARDFGSILSDINAAKDA